MIDLPQQRKYRVAALAIALVFLGATVCYIVHMAAVSTSSVSPDESVESPIKSYAGRITYIDPKFYPEDKISFVLVNSKGEEIILLKASDEKLMVSEGLDVEVVGQMAKTKDGKEDVLIVSKVVIKNGSD